jgi:hypothetical protein
MYHPLTSSTGLYHPCTGLYHPCTGLYHPCTGLYHACTMLVPCVYHACTGLYHPCTMLVPWLCHPVAIPNARTRKPHSHMCTHTYRSAGCSYPSHPTLALRLGMGLMSPPKGIAESGTCGWSACSKSCTPATLGPGQSLPPACVPEVCEAHRCIHMGCALESYRPSVL